MNGELKFKLYDKVGNHIGYEFHEPNEYGVIQIYHQSLRGDFDHDDKRLVREGYFIPCFHKVQFTGLTDKNGKEAYVGNVYKETRLDGAVLLYKIFNVKGGFAVNIHQDDFYKAPENIIFYSGLSDMQTASWFESNLEEIGNVYQSEILI